MIGFVAYLYSSRRATHADLPSRKSSDEDILSAMLRAGMITEEEAAHSRTPAARDRERKMHIAADRWVHAMSNKPLHQVILPDGFIRARELYPSAIQTYMEIVSGYQARDAVEQALERDYLDRAGSHYDKYYRAKDPTFFKDKHGKWAWKIVFYTMQDHFRQYVNGMVKEQ